MTRGGRYVASTFPGGPKLREAPKPLRENDKFSTKPAPGPRGGTAADDVAWARARRREREANGQ